MRVVDGKFAAKTYSLETYELRPGVGGRFFYTTSHVYDEELRRVHPPSNVIAKNWILPAVHGPLCLELEQATGGRPMSGLSYAKAHLFFEGQFKPVAMIEDLDKYAIGNLLPFFIPRYGRLVFLGKNNDQLILYPFDLDSLLAKSEVDYLVVLSEPPQQVVAGKTFEYTPVVKSKKGGVKVKLDAGPDGMKIDPSGKLTWAVPAAMAKQEAVVILSVSDSSSRDTFHTFRLAVVAPPVDKP
jgi:hypothetical protein